MIQKAISGLSLDAFGRIIFTIVREHDEQYQAASILRDIYKDPKYDVLVLDKFTRSAAETVFLTLRHKDVKGSFVVKDSDNFVCVDVPIEGDSFVVGLDINRCGDISNIAGKSFILTNEQDVLVDIVEKSVCSNLICLGVYAFADAEIYRSAYQKLIAPGTLCDELYVSHVMAYLISHDNAVVRYVEATAYEDWGTVREWQAMQARHRVFFVDVDGVLLKNSGRYGALNWGNNHEALQDNCETIRLLQENGGQVIVVTSRPEQYRAIVEEVLRENGIRYHAIVMGCHHAQRVIVNDFAASNPYPSCVAVNVPRDGSIRDYLSTPAEGR